MRTLRVSVLALALLGLAPATPADDVPALVRLQRWLDGTKDLQARFEQTLVSSALGAGPSESGRVYLRRPGRMRWEYTKPEAKIALLVDRRAEIYLAAERRLHRADLSREEEPLAALLSGTAPLGTVFAVSPLPPAHGLVRLKLVPRNREAGMQEIVVGLDPDSAAVLRIETLDQGGNRMAYVFSGLRRNAGIAEGVFRFTPPAGTEVVEGL
jgi:outer membrane lipoprotein carrier protein